MKTLKFMWSNAICCIGNVEILLEKGHGRSLERYLKAKGTPFNHENERQKRNNENGFD